MPRKYKHVKVAVEKVCRRCRTRNLKRDDYCAPCEREIKARKTKRDYDDAAYRALYRKHVMGE